MFSRYYDTAHFPMIDLIEPFKILDDYNRGVSRHRFDSIDDEGIKIELPGVKLSDIDVTVYDRTLKVTGKSRRGTDFNYSYSLKSTVDESAITAKLQDGLLEISLPKKSDHVPRKILVAS